MAGLQNNDLRIEEKILDTSPDPLHKDPELQSTQTLQRFDLGDQVMHGPRFVLFLFGLSLAMFLSSLDVTIIASALPRISSDFNAQTQMSWVAASYLLATNAFQPLYGRMSDIFGRKQAFICSSSFFLAGSVGCGAANSMIMLIIFRGVQGVGAAGLSTMCLIIMADMFEDVAERAKYQGAAWAAFGVSSVVGPLLGGVFVEHSTWRWCFYLSLPLGVLSIVLVLIFHKIPFKRSNLKEKLARVDYLGVLLIITTVVCLLLPLTWGGVTYAWNSGIIIGLFCAFAVLLVLLVFVESRAEEPIIPPALFLNRDVALIFVINILVGMGFMGATFYIPLHYQVVLGVSTTQSGLLLIPSALGIVTATLASSYAMKFVPDVRFHIWLGVFFNALAAGLYILFDTEVSKAEQIIFVLFMGIGQGLIFQNNMLAGQEAADPKDISVVTALCGFFFSIGSALGVAVCAAAFNNAILKNLNKLPQEMQGIIKERNVVDDMTSVAGLPEQVKGAVIVAYAESFQFLFKAMLPFALVAFLLALLIRKADKSRHKTTAEVVEEEEEVDTVVDVAEVAVKA